MSRSRQVSESIVPELRALQREAPPLTCCFCLKPLKRKRGQGRPPFVCVSADCRNEENAARHRWRATQRREALAALAGVVKSLGWSTQALVEVIRG